MTRINGSFWENMTQRIKPFLSMTQRIELLFFWKMTQRIEPFYEPFFNMTQRIELLQWLKDFNFWKSWRRELNFSWIWRKEVDLFLDSEFLPTFERDSKIWTYFSNMTQRIEPIFSVTQRISIFSKFFDSKNKYIFWKVWLKEMNPIFRIWLKELSLFFSNLTQKNWISFMNMTQRVCFLNMTQRMLFFNMTFRIELFFAYDSETFFYMTQRSRTLSFFWMWLQESNIFWKYVSKNWASFFLNMTPEIEPLFQYQKKDSQIWTFLFSMTQRIFYIEPFFSA